MKACVLHGKKDLRYEDIPEPQITEGCEVKVKILSGGICGSDQHYYLDGGIGSAIVVREPIVIGHEGCGIVEEVGSDVTGIKKGDMVIIRPARPCFRPDCYYCAHHMYSYCENMRHLGSAATFPHVQGLFAEYVVIHKEQCRVVRDMKPEVAAFAEPLGVAYNGVHSLGDVIGKNVLVMGAGPIGILCAAAAKTLGADRVTVCDIRQGPLDIALKMGADEVCNTKDNPEQVKKWAEHKGSFDCALEATGNGFAAMQTMSMVRPEGTISQVGMFGTGHQPTDLAAFSGKGLRWHAVFRFYKEFGPAVNALESGIINPLPLLSASFKAEDCVKAMEAAVSPETCKVQVRFY
ncbi:MAG: L-idonate 5-dehydrogenase [Proteobacteria bacterium]|uniref:L-idonate 5-dehydrogenase n=1 Tax=Candidatus Avisuccinivibrio stercorigallinarum TaxID=2840704 RepID=A0A9D9GN56_9GAMM|nr:L-idonate 5-dehydrogenase [Candidatus Avisuccinivibrio stercorigallinarum]